jgi:hypothetical protein
MGEAAVRRAPLFNIPQRGEQPAGFFKALSEADSLCQELDGLRELQTRVAELEATPSLPERMRQAAETAEEVNALCGMGIDEPLNPPWLRSEADRMERKDGWSKP